MFKKKKIENYMDKDRRIEELEKELEVLKRKERKREKVSILSAEVIETNPYSRLHILYFAFIFLKFSLISGLMALQKMSIVKDYKVLKVVFP